MKNTGDGKRNYYFDLLPRKREWRTKKKGKRKKFTSQIFKEKGETPTSRGETAPLEYKYQQNLESPGQISAKMNSSHVIIS